jgi:hypothetical protein
MRSVASALLVVILGSTPAWADAPWANRLFEKEKTEITKDFANVPRGTQLHHVFKLRNIYAVPLEITARSGCGCVAVQQASQTVQPQQEGGIEIIMDARRFTGPKKVEIHVTVAAPNFYSATTLQLLANSRADVVLNPGQVSLGVVAQGQKSSPQVIDVEYAGALDWRVTEMVKPGAPLDVSYQELYRKPGQVGYRVSVAVKPDAPAGAIKQELYLKTNDPESPLVPILVEGNVQATLSVAPNPVPLGTVKLGQTITKTVVVRGSKPFRVLSVEGDGDGLITELPAASKEVQFIRVKYQPAKSGELHRQLKIKTDLAEEPALTLKVDGTASK